MMSLVNQRVLTSNLRAFSSSTALRTVARPLELSHILPMLSSLKPLPSQVFLYLLEKIFGAPRDGA
jgi:hypothetical protein